MARKFNVELILSAKQNASKAVKEVTSQLKSLKDAQAEIAKDADKAAGALSSLGKSLNAGAAVDSAKKLKEGLAAALGELGKARAATKALKEENKKYAQSVAEAKKRTDKATASYQKAKEKMKELVAAEKTANREAKKASSERDRLAKSVGKFSARRAASLKKQAALQKRIAEAEAKVSEARKSRTGQTAKLAAKLKKLTKAYDAEKTKLGELTAATEKDKAARRSLTREINDQKAAAKRQVGYMEKLRAKTIEVDSELKDARATEKELGKEARASANALKRQGSEMTRLRDTTKSTVQDIRATTQAEKELSAVSRKLTLPVKAGQKKLIAEARAELDKYTGAMRKVVATYGEVGKGTEQFKKLQTSARAAKDNLIAQQKALAGISAAVRKPVTDLETLEATVKGVNNALRNSKQGFDRFKASSGDIDKINASLIKSVDRMKGVGRASIEAGAKIHEAEAAAKALSTSLKFDKRKQLNPIKEDALALLAAAKQRVNEYTAAIRALARENNGKAGASPLFAGLVAEAHKAKVALKEQQTAVGAINAALRKPVGTAKELSQELKKVGAAVKQAHGSFNLLGDDSSLENLKGSVRELSAGLLPGLEHAAAKDKKRIKSLGREIEKLNSELEGVQHGDFIGEMDGMSEAEARAQKSTKELKAVIKTLKVEFDALSKSMNTSKAAANEVKGIEASLANNTGKAAAEVEQLVTAFQRLSSINESATNKSFFADQVAQVNGLERDLERLIILEMKASNPAGEAYLDSLHKQREEAKKLGITLNTLAAKAKGTEGLEFAAIASRANKAAGQVERVKAEYVDLYNKGKLLSSSKPFALATDALGRLDEATLKSTRSLDKLERRINAVRNNPSVKVDDRTIAVRNQLLEKETALQKQIAAAQQKVKKSQGEINSLIKQEKEGRISAAEAAQKIAREADKIERTEQRLAESMAQTTAVYNSRYAASKKIVAEEVRIEKAIKQTKAALVELNATGENSFTGNTVGELQAINSLNAKLEKLQSELKQVAAEKAKVDTAFNKSVVVALPFGKLKRAAKSTKDIGLNASKSTTAVQRLSGAVRKLSGSFEQAAAAQRKLNGGTRSALGYTQRLRGQVISLITAYAGFFEVIQQIKEVGQAVQDLQAIHSTLLAVTDGDNFLAGQEYNFVIQQAERLGYSVKKLAKNYSDFALAAKNSGQIASGAAREIFVNFTEIGRALHLPGQQVDRITLALQQMASKGTVQMEELKRQLGDAIPGAVGLMAKAVGVSTRELYAMIKAGKVGADVLLKFSRIANKELAGGLEYSLDGLQAAYGRLETAVFLARNEIAENGMEEALRDLANSFTAFLKSAEGRQTLEQLGGAMQSLVGGVQLLLENLQLLKIAFTAFASVKASQGLVLLAGSLGGTALKAKLLVVNITKVFSVVSRAGGVAAGAAAAFRLLTGAMLANPYLAVGAAVFALVAYLTGLFDQTKSTNTVLNEHKDVMKHIGIAYQNAEKGPDRLRKALEKLSRAQLTLDLRQLKKAQKDSVEGFKDMADAAQSFVRLTLASHVERSTGNLARSIQNGVVQSYKEASDMLDQIVEQSGDLNDADAEIIDTMQKLIEKHFKIKTSVEETQTAIDVKNGKIDESAEKTLKVRDAFEDVKKEVSATTKQADAFNEVMKKIKKSADKVKGSIEAANTAVTAMATGTGKQIVDNFDAIAASAGGWSKGIAAGKTGLEASMRLIQKFEGFSKKSYWDVNHQRNGFGSDTMTSASGKVSSVKKGDTTTLEAALRDLARRIKTDFVPSIERSVGKDKFQSMNPQQQAALTSIAYNYGSLPKKLAKAIKEDGSNAEIAAAIKALAGDNKGVNAKRRNTEAAVFAGGSFNQGKDKTTEYFKQQKEAVKAAEKRLELEQKFQENLDSRLEKANLIKELEGASSEDKAVRLALYEAENEAKQKGIELTQTQKDQIAETARLKEQARTAGKEDSTAIKEAAAAQKHLNDLIKQREELLKQIKLMESSGDTAGAEQKRQEVVTLSEEIVKARDAANELNAALAATGDSSAGLAIAKNNTEALSYNLQNASQSGQFLGVSMDSISQTFTSGLTSAVDNFANAVAKGEDAGKAAKRAFLEFASSFLRQIAQMIIRQALLNAMQGASGGGGGGGMMGMLGGLFGAGHHGGKVGQGGRIGSGNMTRRVSPAVFANAPKYHEGGIVGLRPGEVPAILKVGEQVLPANNPNNVLNQAAKTQKPGNIKVVNVLDSGEFVSEGLASSQGENAILNFISTNATAVKAALE